MHTRQHRLIITSLSLAGLCACDFERAADDESFRKGPIEELPPIDAPILIGSPVQAPESCLAHAELVLIHKDATKDFSASVSEGLATLARPGDLLELSFKLDPQCLEEHGPRLTLASYTAPHYVLGPKQPPPQPYDVHTARFEAGVGLLSVRLPDCSFAVDLAFGEPRVRTPPPLDSDKEPLDPQLIARATGGDTSCGGVTKLAISQFDTVEPGWGEAPVLAHFGWQIDKTDGKFGSKSVLTCALDLDADGEADQVISPCPSDTSGLTPDALPLGAFATPGKHRPELVVSDGERRLWAATTVHANHLEYAPDVHFLEQDPGFVSAEQIKLDKTPYGAIVALTFSSPEAVPALQVGEVVVGHGGATGYMIRAVNVVKDGPILYVMGDSVGLEDTVQSGYFGMRDVQVDASDAHCAADDCIGVLTPVTAPPAFAGAPVKTSLALATDGLKGGEEGKYGVKFGVPLGDNAEVEVFAGMVVKDFVIDWGFFSVDTLNVRTVPTFELTFSLKEALPPESVDLGRYYLGPLPTPIPLSIHVIPRLDLEVGAKFSGKLTVTADTVMTKDESGWDNHSDPKIAAETTVSGEQSVEAKITGVLEAEITLGLLTGPYIGPTGAVGFKGTTDGCQGCVTSFAEGGVEFGWNLPWGNGNMFEPIKVVLGEIELWKHCIDLGIPGCVPDPPPPPGGTWGDVHLVSHDGLLHDFQAGGEFVLVRATDAASPFEIQTRQEPLGAPNSVNYKQLSYNTAVATSVPGHTVGLYTHLPATLYIDGDPTDLAPGASTPVGDSALVRTDADTWTLTYASGEVLTVDRVHTLNSARDHLNVSVKLPTTRAGAVEGLLGDADGDRSNDIGLGGGGFLAQPVSFVDLYTLPASFANTWRVAPAHSLFVYGPGTGFATFRKGPYTEMPTGDPTYVAANAALAQQACATCPESLRGTCLLDLTSTGDVAFAAACNTMPVAPQDEMPVSSDDLIVASPGPGAPLLCPLNPNDPYAPDLPRVVIRAPGIADAHIPSADRRNINVIFQQYVPQSDEWLEIDIINNGNYELTDQITCKSIGNGWGECTFIANYINVGNLCAGGPPTAQRRVMVMATGDFADDVSFAFSYYDLE